MVRFFLLLAAVNGLLCVILGAFGAHALQNLLAPNRLEIWQTAVQYQMFHTTALLAVAFLAAQQGGGTLLAWSGGLFLAGIVLFSGSLYVLSLSGVSLLGMITPLGGLAFIGGWGLLALSLFKA